MARLLYKIVHNLIDISPVDLIPVTSNTRGHDQRFHHIYARTNQYSNSFFPRSIRLWNSLPPDLIQQQSLQILKYQLKLSRLTVVSRAAKKLQSARPIKRRAATTVSYLRVGPVSQY